MQLVTVVHGRIQLWIGKWILANIGMTKESLLSALLEADRRFSERPSALLFFGIGADLLIVRHCTLTRPRISITERGHLWLAEHAVGEVLTTAVADIGLR